MSQQEYFNRVPEWPNFSSFGDETSGRVPVTKVNGWKHFCEVLEDKFLNRGGAQLVFRGHRRYDWSLSPSLGRPPLCDIITEEVAEAQLCLFRRAVRGRLNDKSLLVEDDEDAKLELWAVGQHHGLMTPLIDWTYSPYVSLFFAFEKEDPRSETDNPYRAVFVLNKSHVELPGQCSQIHVLEPRKDDHGRLVNQAGLFTLSTYGNTLENTLIQSLQNEVLEDVAEEDEAKTLANYICKIYIPNRDREGCLRHLRRMNVHHASLFPDLLGAAEYCNILAAENSRKRIDGAATLAPITCTAHLTGPTGELSAIGTVNAGTIVFLEELLRVHSETAGIEIVSIHVIAAELAQEIGRNKVVDWEKRDAVQAKLRNVIWAILRKYGFPHFSRTDIVEKIIEVAARDLEGGE